MQVNGSTIRLMTSGMNRSTSIVFAGVRSASTHSCSPAMNRQKSGAVRFSTMASRLQEVAFTVWLPPAMPSVSQVRRIEQIKAYPASRWPDDMGKRRTSRQG